ncbi:hypothetical protein Q5H91_03605 [Sphingomonas sp. KR1UV-12]|uniref:Uncharacterized protein n=1 Tax=Sphingomonas aurea TaxID=3063994 RepID=A0ABT9EH46_9SPHN|nr:hypothetical protein [Sphingomonas sp. KR1UV-12]MDP1026286.1 hypothetical protein [Sphingomonas sp. KR1UV-12]
MTMLDNIAPRQPSLMQRLRAFWRRIEPGITVDRANSIERWDCNGEGAAINIAFEGFGLSFSVFVGRTPPFRPHRADERTAQLTRWYNGEDC